MQYLTKVASGISSLTGQSYINGLGLTPQMGWNSWNYFHCNISQTLI